MAACLLAGNQDSEYAEEKTDDPTITIPNVQINGENTMREVKLKNYQQEALENTMQQFEIVNRTCCILPTGTGKSYVAMTVADQFTGSHVL